MQGAMQSKTSSYSHSDALQVLLGARDKLGDISHVCVKRQQDPMSAPSQVFMGHQSDLMWKTGSLAYMNATMWHASLP